VLFLVGFSGNNLLGLLLWWHRELFFGWNHGRRQCWGVRKSEGVPEHESREGRCVIHERQWDKESPKVCTCLKSCEPLYISPCAPFYRETKGLLHSENTLESREYSQCEHVHKRLLHPVTYEANFIYLQACH
jgi:hypothetical protein